MFIDWRLQSSEFDVTCQASYCCERFDFQIASIQILIGKAEYSSIERTMRSFELQTIDLRLHFKTTFLVSLFTVLVLLDSICCACIEIPSTVIV